MNMFNNPIYKTMEWVTRFAYLNLLWIIFSISGLVVFGFFPSTMAMFAIMRDWLTGKTDTPIFESFWNHFKSGFMKANLIGIFVIAIGGFIALDLFYIITNTFLDITWTYIPLFAFMLLFFLLLMFLFPTVVHYDLKPLQLIKNAFLIMLISPVHSLLILISLTAFFFIVKAFPAIGFIFGGSFYAFITTRICLHAFTRILHKS